MPSCALTINSSDIVRLGHGSGGRLSQRLIEEIFLSKLGNPTLIELDDAATPPFPGTNLAVSTDSYVVKPLFFQGGDIGSLSVHGTANDLAMRGAKPLYLTAGFILEEGFPFADLKKIVSSFNSALKDLDLLLIAADTKVINKGSGDGIYINTTGIGELLFDNGPAASKASPGDYIIVNGDIGRHGITILIARDELKLESDLESDSQAVFPLVESMYKAGLSPHTMRDATRGGLSSALNEIASSASVGIALTDSDIPVSDPVKAACELLGLDPLYVACEGRFVTMVPPSQLEQTMDVFKKHPIGKGACIIGRVVDEHKGKVVVKTSIGGTRVLDKLAGDQLPRIC